MSQRLTQFDILKGIGILCVLLGHTVISGYPKELIYGFHMPLFFFCSGVFFKQRPLKETFIKSVKQLLVPYLFFFAILQGSYFLIELKATHSISLSISNVFADLANPLNEDSHYYLTIWFLICLFTIRQIYAVLTKYIDNQKAIILFGGGYFLGNQIDMPFFLDTTISTLIFYALGNWFFSSGNYLKRAPIWITLILAIVYCVTIYILHPHIDLKYNIYPWYAILLSMAATWILYQLSVRLADHTNCITQFLIHCGNGSLTMLGFHRPIWLFVYPVCCMLHLNEPLFVAFEMLSAVPIALFVDYILTRYAPVLLGKKK